MRALNLCVLAMISAFGLAYVLTVDAAPPPGAANKAAEKTETKPATDPAAKGSSFDKIKSLSGDWEVTGGSSEHGNHGGTVSYKITAGGSAVVETVFGGSDHEMITVYYADGDELALTHYCVLQNRPMMREERQDKADQVVLSCGANENAKIADQDHMHQVTYTFVDADHIKTAWVLYKGGKAESTHTFELARKKSNEKKPVNKKSSATAK